MTTAKGTDVEYLGTNSSGGVCMGASSSEKIGFFGKTPIARTAITPVATATATTTLNETKINRLYVALRALGIIATG